jgi:ketosteroid isomerase-like protein
MSRDGAPVVRMALRVGQHSRRTLDERFAIRFPRLAAPWFRLFASLPPSSRVRQALLRRSLRKALEAYNRRDLDAVMIGARPDLEWYPYREFVEAALAEPCYHGPAGYRAYILATEDVWGGEVRVEPTEVIDLGDQVVILADMPMRAQASGVQLAEKYACVMTLEGGKLIRQRDYLNHAEALASVGLD